MKLSNLQLHNKIRSNTGLPASSPIAQNIYKAFANKEIPDKDYDRVFHLAAFLFTYHVPKIADKKEREAAIETINSYLKGSNILTNLTKFAKSNVKEQDRDAIAAYINAKIVDAGLNNTLKPAESVAHAFAIIYENEILLKEIQARENQRQSQADTNSTIQNTVANEQTLNNESKNAEININETTDNNNNEEREVNNEQTPTQSNQSAASSVSSDTTENTVQSSRINTLKKNYEPDNNETLTSNNVTKESKIIQPGTIVNKLKEQFERRNKAEANNSLSDSQINNKPNIVVDETLPQRKAKLKNNNQTVSRPSSAASGDPTRTINVGGVKNKVNTFTSTVLNEHEKTVIERGKKLEAERLKKFQQAQEEKDKVSKLHINATQQTQNNKIEEAKQRRVDRETTVIDNRFHNLANNAVALVMKDVPETFFASDPEQFRKALQALALAIQENNVDNKNIKMDVELPAILKDVLEIAIRKDTDKSRINSLLKKLNVAVKQPEVVEFLNQLSTLGQTNSLSNLDMLSAWLNIIKNHSLSLGEVELEINADFARSDAYEAKTETFNLNEVQTSVEFHSNEQEELDLSRPDTIENNNSPTPQEVPELQIENQEDLTVANINNNTYFEDFASNNINNNIDDEVINSSHEDERIKLFESIKSDILAASTREDIFAAANRLQEFQNIKLENIMLGKIDHFYDAEENWNNSYNELLALNNNRNILIQDRDLLFEREKLALDEAKSITADMEITDYDEMLNEDLINLQSKITEEYRILSELEMVYMSLSNMQKNNASLLPSDKNYQDQYKIYQILALDKKAELLEIDDAINIKFEKLSSDPNKDNHLNEGEEKREFEYDSSVDSISSSDNSEYGEDDFDLDNLLNDLRSKLLSQRIIQDLYNDFARSLNDLQANIGKLGFTGAYKQASSDYQIINNALLKNIPILNQLTSMDKDEITWKNDLESNNNMLRLLNEKNKLLGSLEKLQTHLIKLNILKNNINIVSANLTSPGTIEALNQAKANYQKYKDEYAELKLLIEKDGPDIAKSYVDPVNEKLNELGNAITNYKVIAPEDDLPPPPPEDDLVDLKTIIADEPEGPKLAADYIADWDNPADARDDIASKFEDARQAYENGEYAKAESEYHLCRLLIVGFKAKFPDHGLADLPDRRLEGERLLCSAMEATAAAQIEINKPNNTGIRNAEALQSIERAAARAKLAVSELAGEDSGIWNPDDYTDQYEFELTHIKNLVAQAKSDQKDLLSQADKASETNKLEALIDHFKNYRNPQSEFGTTDLNAKKDLHVEWEKFNNLRDALIARKNDINQIRPGLEESENANGPNVKDVTKRLSKLDTTEELIDSALDELNAILKNIERTRVQPSTEMDNISKDIAKARNRQAQPGADQNALKMEIEQLEAKYAEEEKKWKKGLQDQLNMLENRIGPKNVNDEYIMEQIKWTLNPNLTEESATEIKTINRDECASEADYKSQVQAEIAKLTGSTASSSELIALGSDLAVDKRKLVDLSKETVIMKIGKGGQESVFVKEEGKNKQDFSIAIHKLAPNSNERMRHIAKIAEQYIAKNPPGQIRITGKDPEMVKEVKAYIDAMHDLVKDSKEKSKYERQPDTLGTLDKISHWRKVSAMKSLIEKDKTLSKIVNAKNLYQHKDSIIPLLGDKFETRVGESRDKDLVHKTTDDIRSNNRPK